MRKQPEILIFGLLSIVCAIISMLFSWIWLIGFLFKLFALAGIILGIIGIVINKFGSKTVSILGLILSLIAFF